MKNYNDNVLNFTAQKTIVMPDSRNSIFPVLEEAGLGMNYDKYMKEVTVLDGKEEIARILGIKDSSYLQERGRIEGTPYILGSDVAQEMMRTNADLELLLDLEIGKCSSRMIDTLPDGSDFNIDAYTDIYTKYPRTFQQYLYEYLGSKDVKQGWMYEVISEVAKKVKYSESPDTQIADLKRRFPDENFGGWEVVETGNTVDGLGLRDTGIQELYMPISTGIYYDESKIGDDKKYQLKSFTDLLK